MRKPAKTFDRDLVAALGRMKPDHLEALERVAKTRGRAFFRDPYAMMCLRAMARRHAGD